MKVRMGIKGDPALVHDTCSEKLGKKVFLIRADGIQHQMSPGADYKMPAAPEK
jgi:hypothetical protein